MNNFLANLPLRKVSVFVTIVVSFTYNVLLERDVSCTCEPDDEDCDIYMALPFLIVFFLMLWTDKTFFWSCRYMLKCSCRFSGIFVIRILKAVLVGLLWVVSVYIDGDWYVCRQNDYTAHPRLPCITDITVEEQVIIAKLKNTSRIIGFTMILVILAVSIGISSLWWKNCCAEEGGCCDKRILYDKLIAEEEEIVLDEFLRSKAKEELRENIKNKFEDGQLWECFVVAKELIGRTGPPGQNPAAAEQQTSLGNRTPRNQGRSNKPGPSGIQRRPLLPS